MATATTTAHALLSLIALRPNWSTYELAIQVARNLRLLWPRAESRVYAEAKALVSKGFLLAEPERRGKRPRTVYSITESGAAELEAWLASPVGPTRLQSDALLRVLFGRLSSVEQLLRSVDQIRQDADALFAQGHVVGAEYVEGTAEFQDDVAYRALVFDFLFHHATMLREWADRAEAVIADWTVDQDAAAGAAVERLRVLIARLPPVSQPPTR